MKDFSCHLLPKRIGKLKSVTTDSFFNHYLEISFVMLPPLWRRRGYLIPRSARSTRIDFHNQIMPYCFRIE